MHKIEIPGYALDLLRTRGRLLTDIEPVDPARTALLVVDMQNAFVAEAGVLTITHARDIVQPINQIAAALRTAGGKICWIQTDFQHQAESWSNWFSKRLHSDASAAMISALSPGNTGFEIFTEMDVKSSDWHCIKTRFSPFVKDASALEQQLSMHAIDTLIVTGTVSNTCCESTARDAMMLNYRVIFVSDGNATRTDAEHNATLGNMLQTFADVARSTDIIDQLRIGRSRKSATRGG